MKPILTFEPRPIPGRNFHLTEDTNMTWGVYTIECEDLSMEMSVIRSSFTKNYFDNPEVIPDDVCQITTKGRRVIQFYSDNIYLVDENNKVIKWEGKK